MPGKDSAVLHQGFAVGAQPASDCCDRHGVISVTDVAPLFSVDCAIKARYAGAD